MRAIFLLAALVVLGCPTPPKPPIDTDKPKLTLVVRDDKTAVDLVLDSPVTLSSLQATLTFDPAQIQAGPVAQGPDGPRVSLVFDDAARIPGKLLVGLADVNQNPLPRSGAIARVALQNSSTGDALGLESVVVVDIFGKKVEVTIEGTTVP